MQLRDLFDYKNQLMQDLLTNEKIVKLIDRDVSLEEASSLAYKKVFPYEYIPDTVNNGDTFVCFDVDVLDVINKTFLNPTLYVWVFTHRSNLRLPQGGLLIDEFCAELCEAINGSRMYGMGELEFSSMRRFAPMTDFQGKCLMFKAIEANRYHTPLKPVPENRKR